MKAKLMNEARVLNVSYRVQEKRALKVQTLTQYPKRVLIFQKLFDVK